MAKRKAVRKSGKKNEPKFIIRESTQEESEYLDKILKRKRTAGKKGKK